MMQYNCFARTSNQETYSSITLTSTFLASFTNTSDITFTSLPAYFQTITVLTAVYELLLDSSLEKCPEKITASVNADVGISNSDLDFSRNAFTFNNTDLCSLTYSYTVGCGTSEVIEGVSIADPSSPSFTLDRVEMEEG